jgi:hypothetical protein
MDQFSITLASRKDIVIMRVENGWLIRNHKGYGEGDLTPLSVAETPEALVKIILDWATAQEAT